MAAVNDLDATLEYTIEAEEFLEVASKVAVLVIAAWQYSRSSSAAASLNPFRGGHVTGVLEALIGAADIVPIFEAPQRLPPPLPLPLH